jgi:hypothetical protein
MFLFNFLIAEDETGQRWQDEINSGFDRLVAYATEVDKRRKSTDSNGSPGPSGVNRLGEDLDPYNHSKAIMDAADDVFADGSRTPNAGHQLNMKFKSNFGSSGPRGVVSANSPYARAMPVPSHNSKSLVPSALASVVSLDDLQNPRSPLPGENLPEHHFKKRYFAETRGSDSTTPNSTQSSSAIMDRLKNGSPASSSTPTMMD